MRDLLDPNQDVKPLIYLKLACDSVIQSANALGLQGYSQPRVRQLVHHCFKLDKIFKDQRKTHFDLRNVRGIYLNSSYQGDRMPTDKIHGSKRVRRSQILRNVSPSSLFACRVGVNDGFLPCGFSS